MGPPEPVGRGLYGLVRHRVTCNLTVHEAEFWRGGVDAAAQGFPEAEGSRQGRAIPSAVVCTSATGQG